MPPTPDQITRWQQHGVELVVAARPLSFLLAAAGWLGLFSGGIALLWAISRGQLLPILATAGGIAFALAMVFAGRFVAHLAAGVAGLIDMKNLEFRQEARRFPPTEPPPATALPQT